MRMGEEVCAESLPHILIGDVFQILENLQQGTEGAELGLNPGCMLDLILVYLVHLQQQTNNGAEVVRRCRRHRWSRLPGNITLSASRANCLDFLNKKVYGLSNSGSRN